MFSKFKLAGYTIMLISFSLKSIHAQIRLSADDADKLLIEKSDVVYRPLTVDSNLQGNVKIDLIVSETETVVSRKVISGHPLLISAAMDAVLMRKYKPYDLGGKARFFATTVEVAFSLGISQDQYEREEKLAGEYFKKAHQCRDLLKSQKWKEAEEACMAGVALADKLPEHRQLEKMGAYEEVGHALFYQRRFTEALRYFSKAFEFAKLKLTDSDADMGYMYRNIGMAR